VQPFWLASKACQPAQPGRHRPDLLLPFFLSFSFFLSFFFPFFLALLFFLCFYTENNFSLSPSLSPPSTFSLFLTLTISSFLILSQSLSSSCLSSHSTFSLLHACAWCLWSSRIVLGVYGFRQVLFLGFASTLVVECIFWVNYNCICGDCIWICGRYCMVEAVFYLHWWCLYLCGACNRCRLYLYMCM